MSYLCFSLPQNKKEEVTRGLGPPRSRAYLTWNFILSTIQERRRKVGTWVGWAVGVCEIQVWVQQPKSSAGTEEEKEALVTQRCVTSVFKPRFLWRCWGIYSCRLRQYNFLHVSYCTDAAQSATDCTAISDWRKWTEEEKLVFFWKHLKTVVFSVVLSK